MKLLWLGPGKPPQITFTKINNAIDVDQEAQADFIFDLLYHHMPGYIFRRVYGKMTDAKKKDEEQPHE